MSDLVLAALLVPWGWAVYALARTRDWPAMRAAVREDPRALLGYSIATMVLLATCPIWPLLVL